MSTDDKAFIDAAAYLAQQSKQAASLAATTEGRALLVDIQRKTRATLAAMRIALKHYEAADQRFTRALRSKRFGRHL